MTNKTIFSIDGGSIIKMVSDIFGSINRTRFVATSKNGKELLNMPLLWVVIIGIVFPFLTIAAVIIGLALSYNVSLQKEVKKEINLLEE